MFDVDVDGCAALFGSLVDMDLNFFGWLFVVGDKLLFRMITVDDC